MYIAILGRQPSLGMAELERIYGSNLVSVVNNGIVKVDCQSIDISKLGGTLKAGKVSIDLPKADWSGTSQKIIQHYLSDWSNAPGKITLGISSYGFNVSAREVQKIGLSLKQRLKKSGVSLRLVPNAAASLSTATSHHNKLGLSPNKVELLVIKTSTGEVIVAESTGAQNITAYARRDQARPKRDAFVGMLPPKLAQIMINLATGSWNMEYGPKSAQARVTTSGAAPEIVLVSQKISGADSSAGPATIDHKNTILDPFCGTGVILQEGALMGYSVYGTDLSEKMISYSRDNLDWLSTSHRVNFASKLHVGDATTTTWQQPIDAVIAETYLGQPFSAPPSPAKLTEVVRTCDGIISDFLKNLAPQINPGTPICIAVPAWRDTSGNFTHLPLIETVGRFGYKRHEFKNVSQNSLLYYRENQVVARELLVLTKV